VNDTPLERATDSTSNGEALESESSTEAGRVAELLRGASHLVVLTGAGISTESGIPDFRGPDGVWTKNPAAEKTATLQHYVANAEVRAQAWQHRLASGMWDAEPNAGHLALVDLAHKLGSRFEMLVTQNVDGLHLAAGHDPARVIEIHGNVRQVKCLACTWRAPMQVALDRVRAGEADPACPDCGGILKSATISFGENLVADDLDRAQAAALRADAFLAAGTSLGVYPAAALPELALRRGAVLIVANGEPTPFDDYAEVVLRDRLGTILPAIVDRV
jgi:NAD-dependent deacetylase